MTLYTYALCGFVALVLIAGVFTFIEFRREEKERAERNARIAAAKARYAAEKAARDALQVNELELRREGKRATDARLAHIGEVLDEAELEAIEWENNGDQLRREAAVLRQNMRERGVTSLDAGDILDMVERETPIDSDDEKYVKHIERNRANRENFAAIDTGTVSTFYVPPAEQPKCQSSYSPSSACGSDTPPSTSSDNSPPASTD